MRHRENHLKTLFILGTMVAALAVAQTAAAQPASTMPASAAVMTAAPMPAAMPAPTAPTMTTPAPAMPTPAVMTPAMLAAPATMVATTPAKPTMAAAPAEPEKKPAVKSGEKKDTWWQTLLGGLTQILILFGGAVATTCGGLLIRWLANKGKISNQETIKAMEDLYDKAIALGVQFATQQANKLNNNPDAKAQRIKWATDMATKFIKEWNLPEKTANWIEDRIEAKLGEKGKKPVKPEEEVKSKPEGDNK
jgi:hypothetical protein